MNLYADLTIGVTKQTIVDGTKFRTNSVVEILTVSGTYLTVRCRSNLLRFESERKTQKNKNKNTQREVRMKRYAESKSTLLADAR